VSGARPSVAARVLVVLLTVYRRFISPVIPPSCRFTPSCSAYAVEALQVHGALRGSWLTLRRLLRCAPWHPGGWDPVPPKPDRTTACADAPAASAASAEETLPC
jgi:uncharacterized protein